MRIYSQFSQEGGSGAAPAWGICGVELCPVVAMLTCANLFWQAPTAVRRAMGAVPSSACPTLQGGCAAAPPATTWCAGWHARWHCPARPRSRPALTSRAASLASRSAMGALTALTAPMSLTVSACPLPGCAGVLAEHGVGPAQSPPVWEGGCHLGVC